MLTLENILFWVGAFGWGWHIGEWFVTPWVMRHMGKQGKHGKIET